MARAGGVRLNLPRPVRVRTGAGGVPLRIDDLAIELVRESWLVEDRWWTAQPLRRRYWEVVSASGRNLVVFHDLGAGASADAGTGASPGTAASTSAGTARAGGWFAQGA
jgi:hypothetical protein